MISWTCLLVGLLLGFSLGVLSTRNTTQNSVSELIGLVNKRLEEDHNFHVSLYMGEIQEEDDDDDGGFNLVPPAEDKSYRNN